MDYSSFESWTSTQRESRGRLFFIGSGAERTKTDPLLKRLTEQRPALETTHPSGRISGPNWDRSAEEQSNLRHWLKN
jgi:hypothetical protein